MFLVSCFLFFLDDAYLEKNTPPEGEELSFEVSYSEMVTETPERNKWKKSDIKKEDYALTVSKPSAVSLVTSRGSSPSPHGDCSSSLCVREGTGTGLPPVLCVSWVLFCVYAPRIS